jgi:23S rRNA (adenine2503-C2)-methyltransferase
MRPQFRRKWLPRALEPELALDKLVEWQQVHQRLVALHWTFIAGENDDMGTIEEIAEAVTKRDLHVKFNSVRYNPYSDKQGTEPSEEIIQRNFDYLAGIFGEGSRIVPKIGRDVHASCGCFMVPD